MVDEQRQHRIRRGDAEAKAEEGDIAAKHQEIPAHRRRPTRELACLRPNSRSHVDLHTGTTPITHSRKQSHTPISITSAIVLCKLYMCSLSCIACGYRKAARGWRLDTPLTARHIVGED